MIFREHYSLLCSYANQFLRDPDASEEIVQEVMVRTWENRDKIVFETSAKNYLFRAVRNSCLNFIKHLDVRENYRISVESQRKDIQHAGEDPLVLCELEEKIRKAVDMLPMERKKIFLLSRFEGLTYAEIAGKLNISVRTVENQMSSALRFLREELADYLPLALLFFSDLFRNS